MTTKISFRRAGNAQPLVLVPVHVNGRGPHEFILDTGAVGSWSPDSDSNAFGATGGIATPSVSHDVD